MLIAIALAALLMPVSCDEWKVMEDSVTSAGKREEEGKKGETKEEKELPTISVLVSQDASTVATFDINGCKLDFEKSDCKYSLTPSPDTCEGKISLGDILNHFFPLNKLAEKTNTFLLPDKFDLIKLSIDKCVGDIKFEGSAKEKFELIPKRLAITGAKIGFMFNYKTGSVDWKKLDLDIEGAITVGTSAINIKLKKKREEQDLKFSFEMDELAIPDFNKLFTGAKPDDKDENLGDKLDRAAWEQAKESRERILAELKSKYLATSRKATLRKRDSPTSGTGSGLATDQFVNLVIKKPRIAGIYNPEGSYEFVMSGLPTSTFFKGYVYAVVQKPKDGNTAVGVVASMENVSPTQILSKITGKDLSTFPLLKDITLNFAAIFANDDITTITDPETISALKDYIGEGKAICKGVVLKMELPVKEIIKKVDAKLNVDDVPETLYCKVIVKDGHVEVKFPEEWKTDLLKILSALSPKAIDLLPSFLKGSTQYIDVKELSFDYKTMLFISRVLAPGPVKFGHFFSLKDVDIKVIFHGNEKAWDFEFSSTEEIMEGVTFTTALTKHQTNYVFKGSIKLISTGQLVKWLGAKFASDSLMKKFSFLDFGIENFKVDSQFATDSVDFHLRLTGTCIMFGWDGVKLEGIVSMHNGSLRLVLGIALKDIRLDEIVAKLFNKQLLSATWLTQMNVGLVMSNTAEDNGEIQFTQHELKDMPLKRGFWFRALFQPPDDCKKDELCLQAKEMMKGEKKERAMKLEGKLTIAGAELRATYTGNWKIGSNIKIQDIVLAVSVGIGTSVWFKVTVLITKPELELEGKIKIGLTGKVTLEAKMIGMWKEPFGLKYVAFGNIQIAVGIQPGVPVPMLKLEAEIRVGKIGNGKEIMARGAVGINPINPLKNYFYGEVSKLSVDSISQAFDYKLALPKILLDTGFPDGLMASFTLGHGKKLEISGVELPAGFALQGTVSLLGLTLKCKVVVDFPTFYEINVEMAPIKFAGGALVISRGRDDLVNGPIFHAKVMLATLEVEIRGFVNILGISSQTYIKIDDKGYTFSVDGSLFGVVEANLTVIAGFASIDDAKFNVEACLSVKAFDVEHEVQSTVRESASDAEEAVSQAKDEVKKVTSMGNKAKKGKQKLEDEVDEYQQKLKKKAEKYKEAKEFTKLNCLDQCQTVCLALPDWRENCLTLNNETFGCPTMNECKVKVLDEKCFAKCAGKNWFKRKLAAAKQTGLKILRLIMKQMRKLYNLGKKFFQSTKTLIGKTQDMLNKVGEFMKPGLDLAKKLAKMAIDNVIKINHMCFKSGLEDAASSACVEFDIDAVVFNSRRVKMKTKGCLDVSWAKTIAKAISDKISPGIKFIKKNLGKVRKLIQEVDTHKDEIQKEIEDHVTDDDDDDSDFDDEITEDDDDDEKAKKKYRIWAETDKEAKKLAHEELPRLVIKGGGYRRLLREQSAPVMAAKFDPMAIAYKSKGTGNYSYGTLKREEVGLKDPCGQMLKVVHGYKQLSTNLQRLVKQHTKQKESFSKLKKKEARELDQIARSLRSQCVYYKCEKGELDDVMSLVDTAKKNHKSWSNIVESQLNRQNKETVQVWRRSLEDMTHKREGISFAAHLDRLNKIANSASKRVWIPKGEVEDQKTSLLEVSKGLWDIFVSRRDMTISKAAKRLSSMEGHLQSISDFPKECTNADIKVD